MPVKYQKYTYSTVSRTELIKMFKTNGKCCNTVLTESTKAVLT